MSDGKENELMRRFDKRFLDTNSEFAASEHGSIAWDVVLSKDFDRYGAKKDQAITENKISMSGGIRIADCSRVIHFDLYCSTPTDIVDRMEKVRSLRDSCNELMLALEEAKERAADWIHSPVETKLKD